MDVDGSTRGVKSPRTLIQSPLERILGLNESEKSSYLYQLLFLFVPNLESESLREYLSLPCYRHARLNTMMIRWLINL